MNIIDSLSVAIVRLASLRHISRLGVRTASDFSALRAMPTNIALATPLPEASPIAITSRSGSIR